MTACGTCQGDVPDGARFCPSCGSPVAAAAPAREERKVVTALFCDLVGFTATSEAADPEDVDRMLTAYAAMARSRIEAFGGVVEKFIGDAVVGVFGVPAAHEDDPERAVRAALRIAADAAALEGVGGAPLQLRIGINTGEVLVRLGLATSIGERFIAGDAINTASRIQSVAPIMGVGVGQSTYEATRAQFDYEPLPPAILKGKAEPVPVFHAIASRARPGVDLTRSKSGAFIGRDGELATLVDRFVSAVTTSRIQLVTVVGEPGIGKSRILAELRAAIDARPELVSWFQGRCLPYGDGVTFWALGEIVKAKAGILETDDPETAMARIDDLLPPGAQGEWLRERLLPLVGVETSAAPRREETFAAWRSFLTGLAARDPAIVVFEDIHWADEAMLDFIEDLIAGGDRAPLLVVATARPELLERRPAFASDGSQSVRLPLAPLNADEARSLVARLLGAVVPPELQGAVVDRAGGNPLYAEEYVRLLKDRGLVAVENGSAVLVPGATLPVPQSINALIAARLDLLPPDRKAMLADAAVIGKVFWAGAVARIGDRDPGEVRTTMDQFARMELVRPAVRSSMAGDAEYAFWHVLTRDVAYAQLPRSARAKRHAAAARWLEGQSGDRAEDIADVLAHHWATALELATASAQPATAEESLPKALRFLTLAGDRALGLDTASAVGNYERALAVLPADHPDRPATLVRYGKAILNAGRAQEALDAMNEAVEAFHARGDVRSEALALIASAAPMEWLGQSGLEISERVVAMLEPLGPSAELVDALLQRASSDIGAAADVRPALELIDRALEMADSLGIPTPSRAYGLRGWGRVRILDRGGFDDFRRAIAMFEERGAAREAGITRMNLGSYITFLDGPREAAGVARDGLELVAGRGMPTVACILASNLTTALVDQGAFDDALEVIARWLGPTDALGNRGDGVAGLLRRSRAQIAWWRGDSTTLVDMVAELRQAERAIAHDDVWVTLAGFVAMALAEAGDRDGAAALLDAVETWPLDERDFSGYFDAALTLVRASIGIGDVARAERLIVMPARWPLIDHILATAGALIAEAQGDLESAVVRFAEAADRWQTFGVATEEALARLGHGRCLVRLARAAEARGSLARARELVTGMGAAPKLAELDALAASAAGV